MVSVGPSGTGKTFITTQLLGGLSPDKYINNIINFSARTSVNYTQGGSDSCAVHIVYINQSTKKKCQTIEIPIF